MPIITIYQGASGEGDELAESIAEALGYAVSGAKCFLRRAGATAYQKQSSTKSSRKGPRWWERLVRDLRPYKIALQATLCELAHDGKVVYHGHLGHELLSGIGHVLKILLTAPIEFRIEQVHLRQSLINIAARHYIEQVDKARSRRLMAMFGVDWRDPDRYDLVFNMGRVSGEAAKRLIVETAKLEEYQPTAASNRNFNDLVLGSRVLATLFASPDVRGSALEVRADGGHVHVKGRVYEGTQYEVIRVAQNVPGVAHVTTDLFSVPPEGVLRV